MLGTSTVIAWVLVASVDLHWSAPAACPSQAEVREKVERYLGADASGTEVDVSAEVLEVEGGAWALTLSITDTSGVAQVRRFEDVDCDGLAETAAVLTALAVSPELEGQSGVPSEMDAEPPPSETAEPEATEAETAETTETTEPEATEAEATESVRPEPIELPEEPPPAQRGARPSLRYGLRAAGGLGLGWLPAGGDLGLAVTIGGRWWAAELEGLVGLPRRAALPQRPDLGAGLLGWSVAARGCGVVPLAPRLSLPLCGGLEGGQVRAMSIGLDNAKDAALPWAAGALGASLRADVNPWVSLWLMPELLLAAVRPQFYADDAQAPIFAAPLASGRLRAGVEVVF